MNHKVLQLHRNNRAYKTKCTFFKDYKALKLAILYDCLDDFTAFLNQVDTTGSIKFTHEAEDNCTLPFLDVLLHRDPDSGQISTSVYRKKTHTDHYLFFTSHHPTHQKLGVVRTLMNRKDTLITQDLQKVKEDNHIKKVLKVCQYPSWTFREIERQNNVQKAQVAPNNKSRSRGRVTLPYIHGVTEKLSRILKDAKVDTSHKPYCKLRSLLVHPKDKLKPKEKSGVVYKVPCKNCTGVYIGETGRLLGTRLKEHSDEILDLDNSRFTRSSASQLSSVRHKSAITDHVLQHNHVADFDNVSVVDRENNRKLRCIKESIAIRCENNNINRDQGGYYLDHCYDDLLHIG